MAKLDFFVFSPVILHYEPKNEIAPFSLCPTWFLKIVPPSGHYPQQKNSPAFLFTQKSVKMRPSNGGDLLNFVDGYDESINQSHDNQRW